MRTGMQLFLAGILRGDALGSGGGDAYSFGDIWQLTRKLQVFAVF
jgi:hypothetical protein